MVQIWYLIYLAYPSHTINNPIILCVSCNSLSLRNSIVLQLPHQTIFRTVSHTNITLTNAFPFVALLLQPTLTTANTAVLCKKSEIVTQACWVGLYQKKSWVGSYVKFINFLEIYNHSKSFDSFDYSVKQLCIFLNLLENLGGKKKKSCLVLPAEVLTFHNVCLSSYTIGTCKSFSAWFFSVTCSNIWQKIVNQTDRSCVKILSRDFHEPITNKFGLMKNNLNFCWLPSASEWKDFWNITHYL